MSNNNYNITYTTAIKQKAGFNFGFLFLWLIYPFAGLIVALKNFRKPESKYLFWLFCVYFGFVFIIPTVIIGGPDSVRYAELLNEFHNNHYSLPYVLSLLYDPLGKFVDIYQPLATWFVSLFTNDPRWLMTLFAAVFGYFYTKNLWILFEQVKIKVNFVIFLFLLGFALVNPIWNINGARMWTAAQVFLYGNLLYFFLNEKKGILWSFISVLIHFSFIFPVIILISFIFLPKRGTLFFIFFLVTSFIKEIDLSQIRDLLGFMPDIFKSRIIGYTNLTYAQNITAARESLSWHVHLAETAQQWFLYLWIIMAFIKRKNWLRGIYKGEELFSLALFLGGWAQLAGLVPSGGRFITVANGIFFFLFVLIVIKNYKNNYSFKKFVVITVPLLLFVVIFRIRVGTDYFGPLLFIGNPIIAMGIIDKIPIIEYVKRFL